MQWGVFVFPIAFFIAQNRFFGWNAMPQSPAELIADGLTFLMFMLACMWVSK